MRNTIKLIDEYRTSRKNLAYKRVKKYVFVDIPEGAESWMFMPEYHLPDDGCVELDDARAEEFDEYYRCNSWTREDRESE